jgi:hypothetical protein
MKVYDLLELCSENTEIVIWDCINGNIIEHYDNIYCVKCYWNDYEIKEICGGINGIDIYVNHVVTNYDDLSVEAKIKCMYNYVYRVLNDPHWDADVMCIRDVEEGIRYFLEAENCIIDKFGNWYDEDFVQI